MSNTTYSFEQVKAITEKYGPVLDQLDRLLEAQLKPATYCIPDYYNQISEMKAAVADHLVNELNELKGRQISEQPVQVANGAV